MKTPAAAATPKPMVSSSPGRHEKFPAPGLARLLRGKSAGRSRARSTASPLFASRSKSVGRSSSSSAIDPALPDAGEPSSPKVTCIGQVRIRNRNRNRNNRKKNKPNSTTKTSSRSADPYRCQCLCGTKKCYSPYTFFFCWRKQKKKKVKETAEAKEAAPPVAFVREFKIESDLEEEEEAGDEETRVFVSSTSAAAADESATAHSSEDAAPPPPPKNAVLLMRCRSAPHNRSSALALSRFPVSPVPASETEEEGKTEEETIEERGRESCNGSAKDEEESRSPPPSQAPSALMRCKSEPAKKAEMLVEVSYCKRNGSGKGGMGVVREAGPTLSPPPPPILLH